MVNTDANDVLCKQQDRLCSFGQHTQQVSYVVVSVRTIADLAGCCLGRSTQWQAEQSTIVRVCNVGSWCVRLEQVAVKHAVPRPELIAEAAKTSSVPAKVDADSRPGSVANTAAEVRGVRVKYNDAVSTEETRHLRQVVHSVEPKTKPADLVGSCYLRRAAEFGNVLEVSISEDCVIVNPKCWSLAFLHPVVKKTASRITVFSLIIQKVYLYIQNQQNVC